MVNLKDIEKQVDEDMDNFFNWVILFFIVIGLLMVPSCLNATGEMHTNATAFCAERGMKFETMPNNIPGICYNDKGETITVRERTMWCDPIYFDPKKGVCENGTQ